MRACLRASMAANRGSASRGSALERATAAGDGLDVDGDGEEELLFGSYDGVLYCHEIPKN